MLVLVGLGLNDEKGITLEALEEVKDADELYLENYTSIWFGSKEKLEEILGKRIELLSRKDLEEESYKIIEKAKNKKIVIFVPGDPLVATTHLSLLIDCLKNRIKYKVIHNASIISAIFETGLHSYKFGKIVTIPLKDRKNLSISIVNTIKENKARGLHTLCLLDLDLENKKMLSVEEALNFLVEEKAIEKNEKIIVASCLGTKNKKIVYDAVENSLNKKFDLPSVIIIPSNLHFSEEEFLSLLSLSS